LRGRSVIVGMVASLCEMHLDYIYHLTMEAHLRKTPKNGKRRAQSWRPERLNQEGES